MYSPSRGCFICNACLRCSSIELNADIGIHCFACGQIGLQEQFLRAGQQVCPNCHSQLRHIGVDYDRPLENTRCGSCDHLFIDADVQARCLDCGTAHAPADLVVRKVASFGLAEEGRRQARHGARQHLFSLQPGEALPRNEFIWAVSWSNLLAVRHQQQHLLLALQVADLDAYMRRHGELNTYNQLDAVLERLRNMLRVTDVCCNFATDTLLVLLPQTAAQHASVVLGKLAAIKQQQSGAALELLSDVWSLPDAALSGNVEQWLTERLALLGEAG